MYGFHNFLEKDKTARNVDIITFLAVFKQK